ncbi:AMP-binding protein [Streptomyces sp. UNOB3_S3]|nr:AMP-binding protein [Streptomyces sp. UNOB3_S3]
MTDIDVSVRPSSSAHPAIAGTSGPRDYPRDRSLPELFEEQAAARPHALAARHGERTLTYGELSARSGALAAHLLARGVEPGTPVGVCGSRSLEALVALLGILKAGCAYVPLDEDLPPARLRAMAEDAGLRAAVVLPGSTGPVRGLPVCVELDAVELVAGAQPSAPAPSPRRTAATTALKTLTLVESPTTIWPGAAPTSRPIRSPTRSGAVHQPDSRHERMRSRPHSCPTTSARRAGTARGRAPRELPSR